MSRANIAFFRKSVIFNNMEKKRILLTALLVLVLLLSCGESSPKSPAVSWDEVFEKKLNETFTGSDSGIVSFKIDTSIIYVEVDDSVPTNEYPAMARAWALHLSKEKQKYSGSNTTALIVRNDKAYAMINYNTSKGFHSQ